MKNFIKILNKESNKPIKYSLTFYINNCKKMSLNEITNFKMEKRIKDNNKYRSLIKLYEKKLENEVSIIN